jgi:hypothetical protein
MTQGRAFIVAVLVLTTLAACGTPTKPHVVGEIPPGPGLLTGEKGAFVIHSR